MKQLMLILLIVFYTIQAMEKEEELQKTSSHAYELGHPSLAASARDLQTKPRKQLRKLNNGLRDKIGEEQDEEQQKASLLNHAYQLGHPSLATSAHDMKAKDGINPQSQLNRLKSKLNDKPIKDLIAKMRGAARLNMPLLMQAAIETFARKVVVQLPVNEDYRALKKINNPIKQQIKDYLISCYIKNFIMKCNPFWESPKKSKKSFNKTYDVVLEQEIASFISPQENYVVTPIKPNCLHVWRLYTDAVFKTLQHLSKEDDPVIQVACFSNDDYYIATGDNKGKVIVWPMQSKLKTHLDHPHEKNIRQIVFCCDNKRLLTGAESLCTLWDISSESKIQEISSSVPIPFLFFNDSSEEIFTLNNNDIVDVRTGRPIDRVGMIGNSYKLSCDGKVLASREKTAIKFVDVNTTLGSQREEKIVLHSCPLKIKENTGRTIEQLSLSNQGRYMTAILSELNKDKLLSLVDNRTRSIVGSCLLEKSVREVQVSGQAHFLTIIKRDNENKHDEIEIVRLYDEKLLHQVKRLRLKKIILLTALSGPYLNKDDLQLYKRWKKKYEKLPSDIKGLIEKRIEKK